MLKYHLLWPSWIPFAAVVGLAGLAAPSWAGTVADTSGTATTEEHVESQGPDIPSLIEATARLRERQFTGPVHWELVSAAVMRQRFAEDQLDEAQLLVTEKVLKKFGLIPTETNLRTALLALLGEQVVGYYDPETRELYALDSASVPTADAFGPAAAALEVDNTLVHELTHALQDQHFDLQRFIDEDALRRGELLDDEVAARLAVAEGDAMMVGLDYTLQQMVPNADAAPSLKLPPNMLQQLMDATVQGNLPGTEQLAQAPPYLRKSLFFPYAMGFRFVSELRRGRGWAGVDEAYAAPPDSTEQILHIERYLTRDRPTPIPRPQLADLLGPGWLPERPGNLGELDIRLLSQEYLGPDEAERVSTGWDGDVVLLFTNTRDGEVLAVWISAWDSVDEAAEFCEAYARILDRRYDAAVSTPDPTITRLWRTMGGHVSLERRGPWVLVIDALPESQRQQVAAAVWATIGDRPVLP